MKAHLLLLSPVLALLAGAAGAEDAPVPIQAATPARPAAPAAPPPPRISLETEPLQPPVQRKFHLHEGFYLRTSLGFGDYRASFSDGKNSNLDFSEHGDTMTLDLLIGGSPSPGVSIGGGLLLEPLFGSDYNRNGSGTGDHGGFSTLVGPFIDGFPDATKGWHLGGLIGLAAQSFQNVNATGSSSAHAAGLGGAAWFGYDFWVAGEWAIGPQLRLMAMRTSDTKSSDDVSAWARSFTIGVSAVFN
jgi:hypothetical protein